MADMPPPVSILPRGALIQAIRIDGVNIVLGFDSEHDYAQHNTPYFGETIGRVANRIAQARIHSLNGVTCSLAANNGPNCLHGGAVGWGKRNWTGPAPVAAPAPPITGVGGLSGAESVAYSLRSPDGDEGFPGTVDATVIYTTAEQRLDGRCATVLAIEYEARLTAGADETVINMTNHSYFNLTGDATIDGTVVALATRQHLPVDGESIPTGGPVPFPTLDTSEPFVLGAAGPDVDHCFTVAADPASVPIDTRGQPLVRNLAAHHPKTGIHLEVFSTEPAFQFYTGHFTDVPTAGSAPPRGPRSGFCCEPGRFVNACNVPEWRGMTVLKKGDVYGARIVYKIWADEKVKS